jgi:inner membrane protein
MKIEITDLTKWNQSMTLKLIFLTFMGLILLIPLEMIKTVILERQLNSDKVVKEISDQWASKQCVSGPVLNIPLRIAADDATGKITTTVWHILPESLHIKGTIQPQIRKRGIYRAVVYDSDLSITGKVIIPEPDGLKIREVLWNEAYFTIGLSDNRGLKGRIILNAGSEELEAQPGVRDKDLYISGITFPYPLREGARTVDLSLKMNLSGSQGLQFTPIGKQTLVELESSWNSPSFNGTFLPAKRTVSEKGFDASWEITLLNRNFPQSWNGNIYHPEESSFGTDLYQPVDHYQKAWRSARYGILFIALTFLALLFIEITRKEKINIFNYLLVSLALVLFFSLLNALSEQIGFTAAYIVSAAATTFLIAIFTSRLLKSGKSVLALTGLLVLLYVFIYILLNLNDLAYLAGNIGLFILLSAIMLFSGRIRLPGPGKTE